MRVIAAVCAALAGPVAADTIQSAEYVDPTTRYDHAVLGDNVEWGGLHIVTGTTFGKTDGFFNAFKSLTWEISLPDDRVFEDLEPRLWDVTGDGAPEVVVVLSRIDLGASLVIMGLQDGRPVQIAATPHIGQSHRWLAPVAAADLDGDGTIEIAYIDRPHLAKTMRIWRFEDDRFFEIGTIAGLTNHKIGQDFIQGGQRNCGEGPEFITANANWTSVMATRLRDGQFQSVAIADYRGPDSISAALNCR